MKIIDGKLNLGKIELLLFMNLIFCIAVSIMPILGRIPQEQYWSQWYIWVIVIVQFIIFNIVTVGNLFGDEKVKKLDKEAIS
jgi:uncharacterized membrane protein YhaH (DUF805 family)